MDSPSDFDGYLESIPSTNPSCVDIMCYVYCPAADFILLPRLTHISLDDEMLQSIHKNIQAMGHHIVMFVPLKILAPC